MYGGLSGCFAQLTGRGEVVTYVVSQHNILIRINYFDTIGAWLVEVPIFGRRGIIVEGMLVKSVVINLTRLLLKAG